MPLRIDDTLDAAPEAYSADTGCADGLLPSCRECPLPRCRLDIPPQQWRRTLARVRERLAAEGSGAAIGTLDAAGAWRKHKRWKAPTGA
jgi:hypothetical protein